MAVNKMTGAHASAIAALDFPLFEFSDEDVRVAAESGGMPTVTQATEST